MTRVSLICRGATAANRHGIFGLDEALTAKEAEKAAALAALLPRFDRMLAAPEDSTRSTAAALHAEARTDAVLADLNYGAWRGKSLADIAETDPQGLHDWLANPAAVPHGGESVAALHERAGEWLRLRSGSDGHVVAVTHAAVIRALVVTVLDAPLTSFWKIDIAPLTITELRSDGRRWSLHRLGAAPEKDRR